MDGCQEDLESPQLGGTALRGSLLSVTYRHAIKQSKMTFLDRMTGQLVVLCLGNENVDSIP